MERRKGWTGELQEALLSILCYNFEVGQQVRALVPVDLFDLYFKDIASSVYSYYDDYGQAPGEHTIDIFDEHIENNKDRDGGFFTRLLDSVQVCKDDINTTYILDRATSFVRRQKMRQAMMTASNLIGENTDESIDKAEELLKDAMMASATQQHLGTFLYDDASLDFLDGTEEDTFRTGIKEIDAVGLGPARKELHLFMAPSGYGKTWWFIHLGRTCLSHGLTVAHVTLEMIEKKILRRYHQAFFALSNRPINTSIIDFQTDELGRYIDYEVLQVGIRPAFSDENIRSVLASNRKKLRNKLLVVKEFPTGSLTMSGLTSFLTSLEMRHRFRPDVLIIDYPDLMEVDPRYYRQDIGRIFKQLRGLAKERNIAVCVASQTHRAALKAEKIGQEHVAEDISKINTSDTIFSYGQKPMEKELGLARINIVKGRGEQDGFQVLICQNYHLGQFCVTSTRMDSKVNEMLKKLDE